MAWVFDTLFSTVEDLTGLQLDIEDLPIERLFDTITFCALKAGFAPFRVQL